MNINYNNFSSIPIQDINLFERRFNEIYDNHFSFLEPFIYSCTLTVKDNNDSFSGGSIQYDSSCKTYHYLLSFNTRIFENINYIDNIIYHELYHCEDYFKFYLRIDDFDKSFEFMIFDEFKDVAHYKKALSAIFWSEYYAYRKANLEKDVSHEELSNIMYTFFDCINGFASRLNENQNVDLVTLYDIVFNNDNGLKAFIYQTFKALGCFDYFHNDLPILFPSPNTFEEHWANKLQLALRKQFDLFYTEKEFIDSFENYIEIFYEIFTNYSLVFKCSHGKPFLQIV